MPSLFVPYQIILQLPNNVQPPHWEAPALIAGAHVITNDEGILIYQPAHQQRPIAAEEFTPGLLEAINTQLVHLGLTLNQIVEND